MDIAAWLQDLELQRYVSAFRDNDIDGEILSKLTAEDLIGIGVTSVGVAAGTLRAPLRPESSRTNADDRLPPASLGPV